MASFGLAGDDPPALALVLLYDAGKVIKTSRHQAPPRPPAVETAPASGAGEPAEYALVPGRRYRLALPADASGEVPEQLCHQWANRPFRLRLETIGGGAGDYVLAAPAGAEPYNIPREELQFSLNAYGFSKERFCLLARESAPVEGPLRLLVEGTGGTAIGSVRVRVAPAEPAAAAKKRGLEEGVQEPPPAPSPVASSTDRDDGEEAEADLVEAFGRLGRWDGPLSEDSLLPPPLVVPAPNRSEPPIDLEAEEGAAPSRPGGHAPPPQKLPRRVAPPPLPMACPYRHASEAARDEAAALARAARAAVQAVTDRAGVAHPVSSGSVVPPSVLAACKDLAAALSTPEIFDTALFGTPQGRVELHRAVEDLRLSGGADLVEAVYKAWRDALAAGPHLRSLAPEDAEFFCELCWAVLEVALGPWFVAHGELSPLDWRAVLELLDAADLAAKLHAARLPILAARLLAKRAWALQVYGQTEASIELYFSAWSDLIRAGATPSRLEARVLVELVESLSRVPEKWASCNSLYSRLYWFDGDVLPAYICIA